MRVLAAALLTAVALATAGCGGGGKSAVTTTVTAIVTTTNPTGTASVTTHGRFSYPPVLVDNFMRSCTRGGQAKKTYCACTLDKLSNTVSTQDFTRIGLSGGKVPPRVRRAIKQATIACADKL
ncbi:MAG: hypothetical protein ACXWZ1_01490 [Gaiellaceae bacterium]